MQSRRLVTGLMLLNAGLLLGFIAGNARSLAASQGTLPVLRGRALEIVDEEGLVRASIKVHGEETVNGKRYPGAVVLVMGDPRGAPGVKLAASANSAGLGLSSGQRLADGRSAGIQLHSADPVVLLIDKEGRERALKP
jgi:hypothetical protein